MDTSASHLVSPLGLSSCVIPPTHYRLVAMYISALGGKYPSVFWIGFCSATFFECFVELLQPWILGAWATEYRERPASEVNVALLVSITVVARYYLYTSVILTPMSAWSS